MLLQGAADRTLKTYGMNALVHHSEAALAYLIESTILSNGE
jgi:hypothetical protein